MLSVFDIVRKDSVKIKNNLIQIYKVLMEKTKLIWSKWNWFNC